MPVKMRKLRSGKVRVSTPGGVKAKATTPIVMFYAERAQGLQLTKHSPILQAIFDEAGTSNDPTALEPPGKE